MLRRDRRRIWFCGVACIVARMLVVMLPWSTVLPMLAKVGQHLAELNHNASPTTAEQQAQLIEPAENHEEKRHHRHHHRR